MTALNPRSTCDHARAGTLSVPRVGSAATSCDASRRAASISLWGSAICASERRYSRSDSKASAARDTKGGRG
eukprot:1663344-Prymnesium_polylepis.1